MGFVYNSKENFLRAAANHNIICFGAGTMLEQLLIDGENWTESISGILDNNAIKQGHYVCVGNRSILIRHPSILKQETNQSVILITCRAVKEIKEQLQNLGILEEHVFFLPFSLEYPDDELNRKKLRMMIPSHEMLKRYFQIFDFTEERKAKYRKNIDNIYDRNGIVVPYMTTLVTSKCTLRCKGCCNLMPYCNYPRNLSKERIINDVDKISKNIDYCVCMNITGGEPLLHENIDEIISAITAKDNILFVEMITNGTVIPPQRVLESLKSEKLVVRISKYAKYSKITQLTQLLKKEGINFIIKEDFQWNSPGGIIRRNKELERIKYEYLQCWAGKYCKSIWDGNLYACARAAYLHELNIAKDSSDFIMISDENLREKLMNFYLSDYVDACDFCDMENEDGVLIEPAIQVDDKV